MHHHLFAIPGEAITGPPLVHPWVFSKVNCCRNTPKNIKRFFGHNNSLCVTTQCNIGLQGLSFMRFLEIWVLLSCGSVPFKSYSVYSACGRSKESMKDHEDFKGQAGEWHPSVLIRKVTQRKLGDKCYIYTLGEGPLSLMGIRYLLPPVPSLSSLPGQSL